MVTAFKIEVISVEPNNIGVLSLRECLKGLTIINKMVRSVDKNGMTRHRNSNIPQFPS